MNKVKAQTKVQEEAVKELNEEEKGETVHAPVVQNGSSTQSSDDDCNDQEYESIPLENEVKSLCII